MMFFLSHELSLPKPMILFILLALNSPLVSSGVLILEDVLNKVWNNDLETRSLDEQTQALKYRAKSASELPDPVVYTSLQNIPTDTLDLGGSPMTQVKFGIRQILPRGKTLDIESSIFDKKAKIKENFSVQRWLSLKQNVEHAWLDALYWQQANDILEKDLSFLNQTLELVQSLCFTLPTS